MSVFSEKLNELMNEKEIIAKELAVDCKVTQSAMSRYMDGSRMPRVDILMRIAKAIKTTPDYLLGFEGKESEEE